MRRLGGVYYLSRVRCRRPAALRARKTPVALVQSLRDAFTKLAGDKEFMAELKKVGGDDADLLMAKDEPVLRQVWTITPGVQEFVKTITKKHLQR